MRNLLTVLSLALCACSFGCGGPEDGMMEYDAKASETKQAEYAAQQKIEMEKAMKQSKGKGGNPYMKK